MKKFIAEKIEEATQLRNQYFAEMNYTMASYYNGMIDAYKEILKHHREVK